MDPTAEKLYRGASAVALVIGIGALITPRRLVQAYGVDPNEMSGIGAFGWRLFAIRNIVIGGAGVAGNQLARDVVLGIQVPDQAVFAHAYRTRSIPRITSVLAMCSSGGVFIASAIARAKSSG